MPNIPTIPDIRNIIDKLEIDETYKIALKYIFLIGGEPSEVCGTYAPSYNDAHYVDFKVDTETYPAVMFAVKAARRRNHIRVCTFPLDVRYETWANEVLSYFNKMEGKPLFDFTLRNFQRIAANIFSGFVWPKKEYRTAPGKKVEPRHSPFTLSCMREMRRKNLREFYYFNEKDMAIFGAWREHVTDDVYLKTDIDAILKRKIEASNIYMLKKASEVYFEKLLRPIDELGEERIALYKRERDNRELLNRLERGRNIATLIRDVNRLLEAKLGAQFMNEDMTAILQIFYPCETANEFMSKMARLSTLFEVNEAQLKKLVKEPGTKKSIKLIESFLIENGVDYDQNMVDTWKHIINLRDMELHHKADPVEYMRALEFFKIRMAMPINHSVLWDNILDAFQTSLIMWRGILNVWGYENL